MRQKTLQVLGAAWCVTTLAVGFAWAEDRSADTTKNSVDREVVLRDIPEAGIGDLEGVSSTYFENPVGHTVPWDELEYYPLPAGTVFERHVVGAPSVVAGAERQTYSNTLGDFVIKLNAGQLIADDVLTTAANGSLLSRFTFQVVGKVDPAGSAGPYTANFALYSTCPYSVDSQTRPTLVIPGTLGTAAFPTDAPATVEFFPQAGLNVPLPPTVWLAVSFNRGNCGIVGGAPALEGFSGDLFDSASFPCFSSFGGFPSFPHGSVNAEVFSAVESLPINIQYRAAFPAGGQVNFGQAKPIVDDLRLTRADCLMVAYEIGVRGRARYDVDLRTDCTSGIIAATTRRFVVGNDLPSRLIATMAQPVPLPQNLFLAVTPGNSTGGPILTGTQAQIGETEPILFEPTDVGCDTRPPPNPADHGTLDVTIYCQGDAVIGACCDLVLTDEDGEAVCRQVPEINCAFPPRFSLLRPKWVEGAVCDPDPFEPQGGRCGEAACCHKTTQDVETCTNVTENECDDIPPVDEERQWQAGRFCGLFQQSCPRIACLGREGDCSEPHDEPGCTPPQCCTDVCNQPFQSFCCTVRWDAECTEVAADVCTTPPSNDECGLSRVGGGASLMVVNGGPNEAFSSTATENPSDPGFCCHGGEPSRCLETQGTPICEDDNDCADGPCTHFEATPGAQGLGTTWFKFFATEPTVQISTCVSNPPATDSLVQVFEVGDSSSDEAACASLSPIGCGDDGCGSFGGLNSDVCIGGLTPGALYYVMVGAKTQDARGLYRVRVDSPCTPDSGQPANNFCGGAQEVSNTPGEPSITSFDLSDASLHCPKEGCITTMENDKWYKYIAPCAGQVTMDTCTGGADPETNLAVYDGCDVCPPSAGAPLACNQDDPRPPEEGNCAPASFVSFNTRAGECYLVRVADVNGNRAGGDLTINCLSDCPTGPITFLSPPQGVTDAGRPNDPFDAGMREGIDVITAEGPPGAGTIPPGEPPTCWELCETFIDAFPNEIVQILETPDTPTPGTSTYQITLLRPITKGAVTTLRYIGNFPAETLFMTAHPGNVNDDFFVFTSDITALVDNLIGVPSVWGLYSTDLDRSGAFTPIDLLTGIELLIGSQAFNLGNPPPDPQFGWNETIEPSTTGCPQ